MENIGQLLQSPDPLALYQALQERDRQSSKTQNYRNLAQSNLGAAGWAGVAGNLIGGLLGRRSQKKLDESNQGYLKQQGSYNKELAAFQAQEEQKKSFQLAQEKQILYERKKADEVEKFNREQGGRMNIAKYKTDNAKSNAPVINVGNQESAYGKISPDYKRVFHEDGSVSQEPIKGSKPWNEKQLSEQKATSKEFNELTEVDNINEIIDLSIEQADWNSTGFIGARMAGIEGSDAFDLAENIKTLEAAASFGALQKMRDNSPTGGALGQVSERELALLGATFRALSTKQSAEQFKQNLRKFQELRNKIIHGPKYQAESVSPNQEPNQDFDANKYVKIDGQWFEK